MIKSEDLNDSIELFLHIFNSMSDLMFILTVDEHQDFRYFFTNEAACNFTGLTQEYYGERMENFLPNLVFEFIKGKYCEAITKKKTVHYIEQFSIPFLTGRVQINVPSNLELEYFESTITPVFNVSGICTHVLVIVRDITKQKQKETDLKRAKEQFELVWNSTADAMYTFNKDENFVNINNSFENLFGWKREEIVNNKSISIIPNDEKGVLDKIIETVKNGEKVPTHNVQRITKDGTIIDVLASYSPIYDEKGNWDGAVAVYKDISEQIHNLNKLEKSEERYRIITEYSSDIIKVTDSKGIVRYASPSIYYQLGVKPETTYNKSIISNVYPEDYEAFEEMLNEIILTCKPASVEFRRLNSKDEAVWFHTIGTPVLDELNNIERIIFVARNISVRKTYEEKLKQLALYDSLTGQPNRRNFYNILKKEIQHAKQSESTFSLMMLDLDRFKQINDTMGHDVGDELLKGFSYRIRSCLREQDILARLGGDEFVILMPKISNKDEAFKMANRIIDSLQKDWEFGDFRFTTTSSIGMTFFPPYHQNLKMLLKRADIALYKAKKAGRNNFQEYQDSEIEEIIYEK
ncbi:diguanylate cyclase domain-containing protein [Gottfriedia solisilvae]|uniref:Diguanylate cyclase n=1 Tax=Gottfriedia solisilvae TaxID=1516104 RepID=A0A8J3F5H2_9BACI|nr:diguanylate cyclase [Gottfriedia solisilvae]GGI17901.1 hypothetical protein GCM10007380_40250 [Gottfriedia solisilvae]